MMPKTFKPKACAVCRKFFVLTHPAIVTCGAVCHAARRAETMAKFHSAHPDKANAYTEKWRQANPAPVRAMRARSYQKHKDRIDEKKRQWRARNRAKANSYSAKWRRDNPERAGAYRALWLLLNRESVLRLSLRSKRLRASRKRLSQISNLQELINDRDNVG